MKVVVDTRSNIAKIIAQHYCDLIKANPSIVLGLATGSTPMDLYNELVCRYEAGEVTFKNVTTFNLDEYVGLDENHPQSYRFFMNKNLFDRIDINKENTNVPSGLNTTQEDLMAYDRKITKMGGIDIQLLGIGDNGHIAFNEPATPFGCLTHLTELTDATRQANARFFDSIDAVPTHACTMGMRSIMNAREIVLIALGQNKATAIQKTVYGPVTQSCPSSVLQLHPNVTIFCDEPAASLL